MNSAEARNYLDIDLILLKANYKKIKERVSPLDLIAVLKADAYGLGAYKIAECLSECGIKDLAVAETCEAERLINLGLPIQILGDILIDEIPWIVENNIIAPICSFEIAKALSDEAVKQGKTVETQCLIDTGMGRLGILLSKAYHVILEIKKLPNLNVTGIYSHFPFAYSDFDFSNHQVRSFCQLLSQLKSQNIEFDRVHFANSDGIHNIDSSLNTPFTHARTGINLYGCFDLEGRKTIQLSEVLSLKSRLVSVREMPWGSSIGYGRTHRLEKDSLIGTVAIGYADGLPISLSNNGHLIVRGKRCPIVGRVSMDYTTILLNDVPEVEEGDEVTCLGEGIKVSDWAASKNSITYEIICSISSRVKRRYIG